MAGSYEHLKPATAEQEESARDRRGPNYIYGGVDTSLIENAGDAIEAMVHMYWMIQILANGEKETIKKVSRQAVEIEVGRARFVPQQPTSTPAAARPIDGDKPVAFPVANTCHVRFCHECGSNVTHEKKRA